MVLEGVLLLMLMLALVSRGSWGGVDVVLEWVLLLSVMLELASALVMLTLASALVLPLLYTRG